MILYVSIISIISFLHFASWALWYAARFVHVTTLKVLVLRDEIEFLFIRNFTFLRFSDLIYLLLCSLLTTFWTLSVQNSGFIFSLPWIPSSLLRYMWALLYDDTATMQVYGMRNDNSPCSQNLFQYKILYTNSHFHRYCVNNIVTYYIPLNIHHEY